jgi:diaminohydroxyphosphoribosylaminopyrimidine deaminase/5-amino-6-(5-phosphoribosylamino)uracil reductase
VNVGIVVGRGRTGSGGRPHGEALALAAAGAQARGSTLYVSLEPCSHHGRTPPCTDAIIEAGISRVVATMIDPDPRVAGRGFERLRAAGVEVETGTLADAAAEVQAGHFTRVTRGRPHVVLKLAVSSDDAIGRHGERQATVTGEIARRHVQALRARFDAILVGRGTVEADDPELTCRLPGLDDRSPIRVILDSEGRLDHSYKIFSGVTPTWVFRAGEDDSEAQPYVRRLGVPRGSGGVDPSACLRRLASEGVTRLLVEGGANVARSFLECDLVDEVLLFRSANPIGPSGVPALAGLPLSAIEASPRFKRNGKRMFGPDRLTRYRRAV